MKRTLLLGLFLFATTVKADLVFKYGLGVIHTDAGNAEAKILSVGYEEPAIFGLGLQKVEVGFWSDFRGDLGRTGSGFGTYSLGIQPEFGALYIQAMWGFGVITNPDALLGGPFQFSHDFGIGLKDQKGVSIGLHYKHFSSAGIYTPNYGRDFIVFKLGFPLQF